MCKKSSSFACLGLKHNNRVQSGHLSPCKCQVCADYLSQAIPLRDSGSQKQFATAHNALAEGSNIKVGDYCWLLLQLCKLRRPLPFKAPDIIFWKKGNPAFIVKMRTGNRLVSAAKQPISKSFARSFLSNSQRLFDHKKFQEAAYKLKELMGIPIEFLYKNNYKAVLRYAGNTENSLSSLLTDQLLAELFTLWSSAKLKKVGSLHSFIIPLGDSPQIIRVHYPSKMLEEDTSQNTMLSTCQGILQNVIDAIEDSLNIRILNISVEFFTTDQEIWINNAWNIRYNPNFSNRLSLLLQESANKLKETKQKKVSLLSRLSKYKHAISPAKVWHIGFLANSVGNTVTKIKSDVFTQKQTVLRIKAKNSTCKPLSAPVSPQKLRESPSPSKAKRDAITLAWKSENFAMDRRNKDIKEMIKIMQQTILSKNSSSERLKGSTGTQTDKANSRWSAGESSYRITKFSKKRNGRFKSAA